MGELSYQIKYEQFSNKGRISQLSTLFHDAIGDVVVNEDDDATRDTWYQHSIHLDPKVWGFNPTFPKICTLKQGMLNC